MKNKISISFLIAVLTLLSVSIIAQDEQKAELVVQNGHTFAIKRTTFNSTGDLLVTLSWEDRIIKLWNVAEKKEVKNLQIKKEIYDFYYFLREPEIAISQSGRLLALGFSNGTIEVFDIFAGKKLKRFKAHDSYIFSISFASDEKSFVTTSSDEFKKMIVWDIETFQPIKTFSVSSESFGDVEFSSNDKYISAIKGDSFALWDINSDYKELNFQCSVGKVVSKSISNDNKLIGLVCSEGQIEIHNLESGGLERIIGEKEFTPDSIAFSSDGKSIVVTDIEKWIINRWQLDTGELISTKNFSNEKFERLTLSPYGNDFVSTKREPFIHETSIIDSCDKFIDEYSSIRPGDQTIIKLWDVETGKEKVELTGIASPLDFLIVTPDKQTIISSIGYQNNIIKILNLSGENFRTLKHPGSITSMTISNDGKLLASGDTKHEIRLWEIETGKELKILKGHGGSVDALSFSPDGKELVSRADDKSIFIWNIETGTKKVFKECLTNTFDFLAISPDGKKLVGSGTDIVKIWDLETGNELRSYQDEKYQNNQVEFSSDGKNLIFQNLKNKPIDLENNLQIKKEENGEIIIFESDTKKEIVKVLLLDKDDWIITTPEGRFDTNKSLDNIEGLHWIVNDEILNPLPLDVFMRQYYEPNLLQRVLANEQFKPLPSIADINRVQPKVAIKEIKTAKNADGLADVTVEVESITEDVSISAADRTLKKKLTSKAFDLRLFRDGQLVGVSTPKDKLAPFIKNAPALIEQNKEYFKKTGKLTDTPEDKAWREANDIFAIKADNVKRISDDKLEYTFSNIRLPKDGRETVEFTAYAFNEDKVKSTTTEPFKFPIPKAVLNTKKKGRAFVVSIGVNASQNPRWDLLYAANDARKMQEIVGGKLDLEKGKKYEDVIKIPLISDYKTDKYQEVNMAQKEIIKGVFSLLAGNEKEVSESVLKQIPNREKIKQIEPEDTLIISFSGHGYADRSGIFYLLPYDIGENTTELTNEVLQKTISSDELSLWMQDITAAEMIMIIDACYSSSAVGADFKPGPMGSRGLGQLAYDKDMKILSATQANNVALELGSLQQGLLSYALLEDGINKSLADTEPKDKKLLSTEWLSFAEKRVPELYQEVKDGKRSIIVNGKNVTGEKARAEVYGAEKKTKSSLNLQQPTVFDFKRRNVQNSLFILP